MGNLSNLYISQSYQSLIHLGTNNQLVSGTMTQLQDGLGNSLNVYVDGTNISSSGNIYAANITGSGGSINTGSLVTTSSFNSYTSSTNARLNSIETTTASLNSSSSLSLYTASFNNGTRNLTFTKGNNDTFSVNIPDVSGSTINTGSFVTTSSFNAYTSSVNSDLNSIHSTTASLNTATASFSSSINQLNASSASQQSSINAINSVSSSWITENETGSFATTGSNTFTGQNIFNENVIIGNNKQLTFTSQNDGNGDYGHFNYYNGPLNNYGNSSQWEASNQGNGVVVISATNPQYGLLYGINLNGNVFVNGNQNISGSLTASLQEGYAWVGDSTNTSVLVATSSFGGGGTTDISSLNAFTASQETKNTTLESVTSSLNSYTQSNDAKWDTLGAKTGSYVTSAITASSLVTASFSGNTLTFTKGDSSTFGVVIPDVSGSGVPTGTVSSSAQILAYNIFATTGSNTFIGTQTIKSAGGNPLIVDHYDASPTQNTLISIFKSGSAEWAFGNLGTDDSFIFYNPNTFQVPVAIRQDNSVNILGSLTASLQQGYAYVGDGSGKTSAVATSSFAGATINTGSFATTGSNLFIGEQTLSDSSANASTISPWSGSFVLVAKGTTSGSAGLSNITSSLSTQVNLILKQSTSLSASFALSGSNNIIQSPSIGTAGFRRQVGGSNIMITGQIPEVTGSATYQIGFSNNYANNIMRLRGPASSSAWSFTNNIVNANLNIGNADATSANQAIAGGNITTNLLLAAVNYNAYTTPLSASAVFQSNLSVGNSTLTAFSSSINAANNIFVGNTFTVNNRYYGTSSTPAAQRLSLQNNVFGGLNTPTLTAEGSNTTAGAPREVHGNTTNGAGLAIGVVLSGDNSNLYSTLIHGSNLTVTGSNAYNTQASAGSTFIGRNNALNGTRASSGETIFAVGTGTGTGTRKTGFLIDSGSNTFVEGTLNVSGSTSFNGAVNITGSLTSSLTQGYVWVGGAGNITTLVATSSFAGGSVPAGTVSSSAQITAFGFISSSTIPTGTVSSSAQILGYNIFATTGSNTFTGGQTIRSGGGLELAPNVGGGGSDNFINIKSENQSTMYLQNTVVSSGYQSGSVLQLSAGSGSNGYGFSGSATFQMDAKYNGYASAIKVQAINGVGSALIGLAERIQFAKREGFPSTPSDTFRVDAKSIELSGSIKVDTGSSGSAGIVAVTGGGTTVYNGLVTGNSIILATTQQLGGGSEYPAVVYNKSNGQFDIDHNYGGTLNVAYLIINPLI